MYKISEDVNQVVEELEGLRNKVEGKNFLVTGGAGFIGSWVSDVLNQLGANIICIDNFVTGAKENIKHLLGRKNFELINSDVCSITDIKTPDYIIHAASIAAPQIYQKNPIKTLDANLVGTRKLLELAKEKNVASFLFTSTSEVYGYVSNETIPTPETYYGYVNSFGPRCMYDEGKRAAEAYCYSYFKQFKLPVRIARIFNSILSDESVILFNDDEFHFIGIGEYVDNLLKSSGNILVPSFNPQTLEISLSKVSAVIKHPYNLDAYEIKTSYGRKVKVTGDHSVFTFENQKPVAIPVRQLKVGDYVAIPSRLPVIEKDVESINVASELVKCLNENDLWYYKVSSNKLVQVIESNRKSILKIIKNTHKYTKNTLYSLNYKFKKQHSLPLYIINKLNIPVPEDAKLRVNAAGAHIYIPNKIIVNNDILWLLGSFMAEGSSSYTENKSCFISFSSDDYLLKKAKKILEDRFNVHVVYQKASKNRSPAIYVHSKILHFIFKDIFKVIQEGEPRVPSWIFQLPLSKLKYFLEGFREGDGTHSGKKVGNELCFDTKYEKLANDIIILLLRFGIVGSLGCYKTKFRKRYGDKEFRFYRVTVCNIRPFDILLWDKGVRQKLHAKRFGDLVLARIKSIKKCKSTKFVYDFSVPYFENFVAGNGICCHNTYGPRLDVSSTGYGRVIIKFIEQSLKGKPLTVYGDGSQTRSFCYITDTVKGLLKLLLLDGLDGEVVNIGNDKETKIIDLAYKIKDMTNSSSEIMFQPLPKDDPPRRCPDLTKARNILGYTPRVGLEEGIRKTIEWYKSVMR